MTTDAQPQQIEIQLTEIELRHLHEPMAFINLYFRMCKTSRTYREAYERTEEVYTGYYRKRRYANYESFARAKSHHLRRR